MSRLMRPINDFPFPDLAFDAAARCVSLTGCYPPYFKIPGLVSVLTVNFISKITSLLTLICVLSDSNQAPAYAYCYTV